MGAPRRIYAFITVAVGTAGPRIRTAALSVELGGHELESLALGLFLQGVDGDVDVTNVGASLPAR
jgi:hypothetical protein